MGWMVKKTANANEIQDRYALIKKQLDKQIGTYSIHHAISIDVVQPHRPPENE